VSPATARVSNEIEFNLLNGNLIVPPGRPLIFNPDESSES
jgi:hypothetical protein